VETPSPTHGTAEIAAVSPSFEELAMQQGVHPVREFSELLGDRHPADESVEEFSKLLQGWRAEGTSAGPEQ
jgi:hypothetical protein